MKTKGKGILLSLIGVGFFAFLFLYLLLGSKVIYMDVPVDRGLLDAAIVNASKPDSGSPICSYGSNGLKKSASIVPAPGEKAIILNVEKSKNVGIDVIYKIEKLSDAKAPPEGASVVFFNLFSAFGSPVGFVRQ